jgi:hypothetical protein
VHSWQLQQAITASGVVRSRDVNSTNRTPMKLIVSLAVLVIITSLVLAGKPEGAFQLDESSAGKYDQSELLARMDGILKASIPAYAQFEVFLSLT